MFRKNSSFFDLTGVLIKSLDCFWPKKKTFTCKIYLIWLYNPIGVVEWEKQIADPLNNTLLAEDMGMIDAFYPLSADFAGINDTIDFLSAGWSIRHLLKSTKRTQRQPQVLPAAPH